MTIDISIQSVILIINFRPAHLLHVGLSITSDFEVFVWAYKGVHATDFFSFLLHSWFFEDVFLVLYVCVYGVWPSEGLWKFCCVHGNSVVTWPAQYPCARVVQQTINQSINRIQCVVRDTFAYESDRKTPGNFWFFVGLRRCLQVQILEWL